MTVPAAPTALLARTLYSPGQLVRLRGVVAKHPELRVGTHGVVLSSVGNLDLYRVAFGDLVVQVPAGKIEPLRTGRTPWWVDH